MLDSQREIEALAAELFNAAVLVGGTVLLRKDTGERARVKTRSEAWVLPSGRAVVQIEGLPGCYRLTRVLVIRQCRVCGCTQDDCRQCIEATGRPCHWVEFNLCSACVGATVPAI